MVDYVVVHYHRPDGSAAADCFGWKLGVTGPTGPECDPGGGPVSPDAKMLAQANAERAMASLVPTIHAQVEFWERAALAALAGYAGTMNAPEDMADRVSRLADGLTRQWLRRLQRWSEGEAG